MTFNWKNRIIVLVVSFITISLMLLAEMLMQLKVNKNHAIQIEGLLVRQVEDVINSNKANEELLTEELKDDYITRAQAVSYILDTNKNLEYNMDELVKIADLMHVDEIHLFNKNGVIYSGTVPKYYNYSFDSGEQMAYFKPMLEDKTLAMCQDVTPNTAEEKSMMYAICWNKEGTKMVQVGIEPTRLLEELRSNELSSVIREFPTIDNLEIIAADRESGDVLATTIDNPTGVNLVGMGINADKNAEESSDSVATVCGVKSQIVTHNYSDYTIVVTQSLRNVNRGLRRTLFITFWYLVAGAIALIYSVHKLSVRIVKEHDDATTDPMTGFLNRRAYEDNLIQYIGVPREENFVYISMDLNGLKTVNDSLGHVAGDELIIGAAYCIDKIFGAYGRLYRIGGDEFVAIVFMDENKLKKLMDDFAVMTRKWRGQYIKNGISISSGAVAKAEVPEMVVHDIAILADERMYKAKSDYYKNSGMDRRRR